MKKERIEIIALIEEAQEAGARQSKACEIIGISPKTLQRWHRPDNGQDGRLQARHEPVNKLTEFERQRIIKVANEPEYADLPTNKIVLRLADKGIYLASESSFYRILKAENQLHIDKNQNPSDR